MDIFLLIVGVKFYILMLQNLVIGVKVDKVKLTTEKKWIDSILERSNEYRKLHSAHNLIFNKTLSEIAQALANRLSETETFDNNEALISADIGQNLYEYTSNDFNEEVDPKRAVDQWYIEVNDFDWAKMQAKNSNEIVSHFTQLVWALTRQIGVAISTKITKNGLFKRTIIVVTYYPACPKVQLEFDLENRILNIHPNIDNTQILTKSDQNIDKSADNFPKNIGSELAVEEMKQITKDVASFMPGDTVNIKGIVTYPYAESFTIDLQEKNVSLSKGIIFLHVKPLFKLGYIEVKSLINGEWNSGTSNLIPLLIKRNRKPFSITLYCKNDHFEVQVHNGTRYAYRHNLHNMEKIKTLGIYGQVDKIVVTFGKDNKKYCYENCTETKKKWPKLCEIGVKQSPIDLPEISTTTKVKHFVFGGDYNKTFDHFYLQNNGRSIQLTVDSSAEPKSKAILSGGGLNGQYIFGQAHFHWANSDEIGSEHLINGQAFPLEVHLVHYNKKYRSIKDGLASNDSEALAVLGSFFRLNNPSPESSHGLAVIIPAISPSVQKKSKIVKAPFKLMDLISPENDSKERKYYRYKGSLTGPPCAETIVWSVFLEPIKMTPEQLIPFRNVMDASGHLIKYNYRKPKPLGSRILQVNVS